MTARCGSAFYFIAVVCTGFKLFPEKIRHALKAETSLVASGQCLFFSRDHFSVWTLFLWGRGETGIFVLGLFFLRALKKGQQISWYPGSGISP